MEKMHGKRDTLYNQNDIGLLLMNLILFRGREGGLVYHVHGPTDDDEPRLVDCLGVGHRSSW